MSNYEKMLSWLRKSGYKYATMVNNSIDAQPVGVIVDTDLYTGPYPDEATRAAVASIQRRAAQLGCKTQAAYTLVCVRVYMPA